MGDSCHSEGSMGRLQSLLEETLPGVEVLSVCIGATESQDRSASYFDSISRQVEVACEQLRAEPSLAAGFNAVGISQGGLFLRGLVQRCDGLPMRTLLAFGSPQAGVADVPGCVDEDASATASSDCALMRSLIRQGVYWSWIQNRIVQAQYFKRWDRIDQYLASSAFLADINNERDDDIKPEYAKRIAQLERLVLVRFENDTMVVPRDTPWFSFFDDQGVVRPLREQPIYTQDRIGLRALDEAHKLDFVSLPGNHVKITDEEFTELAQKYLAPAGSPAQSAATPRRRKQMVLGVRM
ncbi:hypothetical protein HK105_208467 [Polyrhizophydium stewartii]|uniref:Palmitoyl-protein thioesterase 1 n=1 Tax=Polyrhizophydium stewartii TaxID=2732419 RepID=A0ABR4MXP3_9FUNG|nr:hypothetical protein HK105_007737 [Polyrhizophydium stewartii]